MRMVGPVKAPLLFWTATEPGPPILGSCPQQMKGSTSRMQGKEVSEQETRKCTAGIDVSKDSLDAHVLPTGGSLRVANTSEGVRQLKRWLLRLNVELVAIEATGKWHRAVFRSLSASKLAVAVIDPFRGRMFAKAQGIAAKTDRVDAKVLAMYAAMMSPVCRPPTPDLLEAL